MGDAEPEYGSDEYLLQKWGSRIDKHIVCADDGAKLRCAKILEDVASYSKTPLQILAEEC